MTAQPGTGHCSIHGLYFGFSCPACMGIVRQGVESVKTQLGWECPRCHHTYAPWVDTCGHCEDTPIVDGV